MMNDHIISALKPLGNATVDSILPAFEGSPTLIARGTLKNVTSEAVDAFNSPLPFSFSSVRSNTATFSLYFVPEDVAKQTQPPDASAQLAAKPSK